MKHLWKHSALPLLLAALLLLAACGGGTEPPTGTNTSTTQAPAVTVNIATLRGPTGIGMAKLAQNTAHYKVSYLGAATEIGPMLINKSVDIAACPLNVAANLYNKTNGAVQMLAINTLGVLYIVENAESIQTFADLKGKTIYAANKGATPEFILNYLLKQNGLEPGKDVTISYKSEFSEVVALAASGKANICMLPEPNVTALTGQKPEFRTALDLTQEWENAAKEKGQDSKLAQGCIVVRKAFAQEHPSAVADFLAAYRQSVAFVGDELDAAAELAAQLQILPSVALAKKAIPNCNIVCITDDAMQSLAKDNLQILFDANPQAVGNAMPKDDFYFHS